MLANDALGKINVSNIKKNPYVDRLDLWTCRNYLLANVFF